MKSILAFAALSVASLIAVGSLVADDGHKVDLSKIKCVISGKAVKSEFVADYKDAHVYLCCKGCPGKFAKDTKKFATKANHQLVATGQAKQTGCPMSGKKLNADMVVAVSGLDVGFCCKNCKKKASSVEGDEQLELVFSDKAFEKGFKVAEHSHH